MKASAARPVDAQPAGGDAQRVADDRQPGEESGRGAVAAQQVERPRVELLLREQAAEEVGGHPAGGVADGGDGDGERGALGVRLR